jgi:hypothetical protein
MYYFWETNVFRRKFLFFISTIKKKYIKYKNKVRRQAANNYDSVDNRNLLF